MKVNNKLKYLGVLLIACTVSVAYAQKEKPNILYIMSDDHAAHAVGAYGGRLATVNPTPTIDKLAEEGLTFTNCFVTNSICIPSRATILTGQYSQTNGVLDLEDRLEKEKHYLPQEMKKLGYQTAMMGKWHLANEPDFDYYKVLQGQGSYFDPSFRAKGEGRWPDNMMQYKGHSSDVITDQTIEWLENREDNQPFFLMHHFKAPHDNFEYAPRYENYLADVDIPEPVSLYFRETWGSEGTKGYNDALTHVIGSSISRRHYVRNYVRQYKLDPVLKNNKATHLAYQIYLKKYLRCVKGVDDNLARLFAYLKERGLWENTIIVYTSDQGMMLGEHDFMDKRWFYEESIRMPFIVHYPKEFLRNKKSDQVINNTDFAPTLIELAGGKVPEYMQGKSFASELIGETPENKRTATYYRYWMHMIHHDVPSHFGIRTKDYKLIFYYGLHYEPEKMGEKSIWWLDKPSFIVQTPPAWEFYDLKRDPDELVNRYNVPEYQDIIKELKMELKEQRKELSETDENYPQIQKIINENWDK